MREHTLDMYKIEEENDAIEGGGTQYNNKREFNPGNIGNFGRVGRGSIICYNCNQLRHLACDCPNLCTM
jgi:hypothetical protein